MQRFLKTNFLFFLILVAGVAFRLYGLSWDQGYHLHPDERAIVMFTTPLQFPKTIFEFFSPASPWNPHFFAYGSFPLYALKIAGYLLGIFNPLFTQYSHINLPGRIMSVFFDLGTLTIIFLFGKKLFNKNIALLAAFFYAVSVLPIQLSHFYAVDTPLTFFVLLTLYQLINFYQKPTVGKSMQVGFLFGLSLATKTSAIVLITSIGMAIVIDFLLIILKNPHRPHIWFPHLPKFIKKLLVDGLVIIFITAITFIVLEPYALIDFRTFWQQQLQQRQMTYDAFTFPYTLQYVGKIPYWHELKNIFLWGQGPILAIFSFLGVFYFTFRLIRKADTKWAQEFILLTFFITYFLVVGSFAIGFMRYLLPIYPLLCLFAAVFFFQLYNRLSSHLGKLIASGYLLIAIIWPLSFIHIYTKPNTRVIASEWINNNIPQGASLAVEHWDDTLPLFGQQNYKIVTLSFYDFDTPQKWEMINTQLSQTDYLIIASNRLYTPLQKLTNCQKLPPDKCYPLTSQYYRKLFGGTLGFKKVAEFTTYPTLEVSSWKFVIDDSSADESFTVYDHPKVMIFKNIEKKYP